MSAIRKIIYTLLASAIFLTVWGFAAARRAERDANAVQNSPAFVLTRHADRFNWRTTRR